MAQTEEQIKAPKVELRDAEIANLSDADFKTLVIRMLTEMVEYCPKVEEKVKAMKNEIKKNIQETNSEGKEARIQINNLEQKKNKYSIRTERSSKKKGDSYLQRSSHKTLSQFLKRNFAGKKGLERSIQGHERQGPISKVTLSGKDIT